MSDTPTITGPVEALHVARLTTTSTFIRFNVGQIRVGRDDEGCYAVTTDTIALVVARWEPISCDAPAGTEFGVDIEVAGWLLRAVNRRGPFRNRDLHFDATPGSLTIQPEPPTSTGHAVSVAFNKPDDRFPDWRGSQASFRPAPVGTSLPLETHRYHHLLGILADLTEHRSGAGAHPRAALGGEKPGWVFDAGDTNRTGREAPRGLRAWAVLMGMDAELLTTHAAEAEGVGGGAR